MEPQSLHRVREVLDVLERTTGDPGDLPNTLQHIAQIAHTFFAADDCVIFAMNPITGRFITSLTIAGDLLKEHLSYEQPRTEGIAQQVLKRSVLVVEDLEVTPEYHSTFTRSEGIRSFVGLALYVKQRQKALGVLYLNFRNPQEFSLDDRELFQIFADQASYILQETWLLQQYEQVARIGQEINQELATVEILFQKLRENVGSILDISHVLLLAVYQPQSNALDLYLEEKGRFIILNNNSLEGAYQHVIETQKPLFIRERSKKEIEQLPFKLVDIVGTGPEESLIFIPLVLRSIPLGVLSIQHPQPNAYAQEDLFILQLLANHIALALYNIRLYDNLSRLNETGQLLTQQLNSEQVLQATADKIREATEADVVVLYPYDSAHQLFVLPPRIAGKLLASTPRTMSPSRADDIAQLMLYRVDTIFAKESEKLYAELNGDIYTRQGSFEQREKVRSTAAVPLRVKEEPVGVLFANFRQPQLFDAPQKKLIDGLAHYAAIAIKNAQSFGVLIQRRVRELETLQRIDRELSSTLNLEAILNILLQSAQEHVPAEESSISLYNSQTQVLETAAVLGRYAEVRPRLNIPLTETKGIIRWVLEHKQTARVDNVHRDRPWRDLYFQTSVDTLSELDVPLLDGKDVVGVLNFESIREGVFKQEDEDFLVTLAGQAVLAIKNAQAYEREKRLAEEAHVLNQISEEIIRQLDPSHIFSLVLEKAQTLTHSTQGNLMLYDPDLKDLLMVAERGVAENKKGQRQRLDQGVVGDVARHKRLLNVEDLTQPPWNSVYLPFIPGMRSELAVPMLAGNKLRGVINIESAFPNHFSERDERLLQGLAGLAVVALQKAETMQERQVFEKRALSAEEVSSIGQSAFELTHRLGNDLGLIESYVTDIQFELESENVTNAFISKKLENIVRAVRTVLDLSRALKHELAKSTEEMVGEPEIISTKILLEEVQNTVSLPPNIQITLEIDFDVAAVNAIHTLVADILRNLVENAIQAISGNGTITLRAHNSGHSVALEVSDTGVGIPQQKLSKIFDLFYSTKGGFGFGLWSARRNALRNHGDLQVDSQLGKGTTFTLLLPRIDGKGLE